MNVGVLGCLVVLGALSIISSIKQACMEEKLKELSKRLKRMEEQ